MKNIFISPTFKRALEHHCFCLRTKDAELFIQAIAEFIQRIEYGKPLKSKTYVQRSLSETTGFIAVKDTYITSCLMLTYAIINTDVLFCAVLQPLVCNRKPLEVELCSYASKAMTTTMRQAIQHYRRGEVQLTTLNGVFGIIRSYVKE
jgi:hypothetical protein